MKKTFKWLSSFLVAMMVVLMALPVANAQQSASEVYKKVNEANKDLKSGHAKGSIIIDFINGGKKTEFGKLDGDFKMNVKDDNYSGAVEGQLTSQSVSKDPLNFKAYLLDNKAYIFDSKAWTSMDATSYVNQMKDSIAKSGSQELTDEQIKAMDKFYDVKEEGNEVILTLKKDLNAEQVWADIKGDELRAKSIEEAKTKAQEEGRELTAEEEAQFNKIFSVETLKIILAENPVIEQHYDKKTNVLTKLVTDIKVPVKKLQEHMNGNAEETTIEGQATNAGEDIPEMVNVKMDLTFDGMGQDQKIEIPEEAKKAEETTTEAQ